MVLQEYSTVDLQWQRFFRRRFFRCCVKNISIARQWRISQSQCSVRRGEGGVQMCVSFFCWCRLLYLYSSNQCAHLRSPTETVCCVTPNKNSLFHYTPKRKGGRGKALWDLRATERLRFGAQAHSLGAWGKFATHEHKTPSFDLHIIYGNRRHQSCDACGAFASTDGLFHLIANVSKLTKRR